MSERGYDHRRQMGGELIIPVLAVCFTLYYFSTIWNSPWTAQVSAFAIGGVLLLLCLLFFVRTFRMLRADTATLGLGGLTSIDDLRNGRLALFLATLGYVWLIEDLGFTLTTFLFIWVSIAALSQGRKLGLATVIAAVMALAGWAVFIWAFDTRFPRGWFENAMKGLLANG